MSSVGGSKKGGPLKKHTQLAESLSKCTHFSKREVESLLTMYDKKLDRTNFRDILHNSFMMTDDMLMDRVFRGFDADNDSIVSMTEWVMGLSVFIRGTHEEQTKYAFDVYDLNSDGYISREEMFHMLKHSLIRQQNEEDPDEGVKDLIEITLKKLDLDHDSRISFTDYSAALKDEPLLIEAFGKCLPSEKTKECFESLIANGAKSGYN